MDASDSLGGAAAPPFTFSAPSTTVSKRRQLGGRGFRLLHRLNSLYTLDNIRRTSNATKTLGTPSIGPPIANSKTASIGSTQIRFRAAPNDSTITSGTPKNPQTKRFSKRFVGRKSVEQPVKAHPHNSFKSTHAARALRRPGRRCKRLIDCYSDQGSAGAPTGAPTGDLDFADAEQERNLRLFSYHCC